MCNRTISIKMKHSLLIKGIFSLLVTWPLSSLIAQEPITYEEAFPSLEFAFPVEVVHAGDGSNRLFVVEQSGAIKVFDTDDATPTVKTLVDLSDQVNFGSGQEQGLLGMAFHPDHASNRYFYVYHTATNDSTGFNEMVLARYRTRPADPNDSRTATREELFRIPKNQRARNHNGGKIAFGPDGYLYISIGDGGGAGDPNKNAQNLNNIFGSILRIDVDLDGNNPVSSNGNYEIPNDNPRVGKTGLDELYSWGIRNTWKFSFDEPTGNMWGADVGQFEIEEVNLITKGGNYGWNRFEGNDSFEPTTSLITSPDVKPVFAYDHSNGDVSITGGYVYRGANLNANLQGKYIFGDYVTGRVFSLDYNQNTGNATSTTLFRTNGIFVSSFALDEKGELYFSGYGPEAKLYQIVGGDNDNNIVDQLGIGEWEEFNEGTNGEVDELEIFNAKVYVSGEFSSVGNISANNIAAYEEGQGWDNLLGGANGRVLTIAVDANGNLYAGGVFTSIGGVTVNNVAIWDGTSWSGLGMGTEGQVTKIEIGPNDDIYVGGAFEKAGGISVNNIARWDGNNWFRLEDATNSISGTNNEIRAISFDNQGNLYVGGNFDEAGGNTAPRIAVYDGSNWSTLGSGTSGFVQSIVTSDTAVYLGGNFAIAGTKTVNRVVKWNRNNSTWNKLGDGVSGNVNDMFLQGEYLYVAGSFEVVKPNVTTNVRANNIARWSESNEWETLGKNGVVGTSGIINSISLYKNDQLLAGGNFNEVGTVDAKKIGVWDPITNVTSIFKSHTEKKVDIYPNPSTGTFYLSEKTSWVISRLDGKEVLRGNTKQIDVSFLNSGVFLLQTSDELQKIMVR